MTARAPYWSPGAAGPLLREEKADPRGEWTLSAACATADPDAFFPDRGEPAAPARRICMSCPVLPECREAVMAAESGWPRWRRHGVWAAMTGRERAAADPLAADGQDGLEADAA